VIVVVGGWQGAGSWTLGSSVCARGNEADFQCLRFDDHARHMAFDQLAIRKSGRQLRSTRCCKVPADPSSRTMVLAPTRAAAAKSRTEILSAARGGGKEDPPLRKTGLRKFGGDIVCCREFQPTPRAQPSASTYPPSEGQFPVCLETICIAIFGSAVRNPSRSQQLCLISRIS
jgi:hypothetical protein